MGFQVNLISAFKKTSEKSSLFRQDIAGIRGIAVMMVTLCHFGIPGFAGGFIGPDIFFVLSGYLITGILYREYTSRPTGGRRTRKISIKKFYLRRTRRILPAAVSVILFVNIYAKFFLKSDQIAQIRSDSVWTLLFGANINFMRQATDYFAQSLSVSPLQHYWSLSVEEQFYFIWPLLLLWAASFRKMRFFGNSLKLKNRLVLVFSVVSAGSLGWMIYSFLADPTTTYFSTFSRFWELAIGG
ncbi:MAG: acyltransferase, partial [Actinomycetales bacterium]|nr:acyltransferase [Actinomycetales bacterium]